MAHKQANSADLPVNNYQHQTIPNETEDKHDKVEHRKPGPEGVVFLSFTHVHRSCTVVICIEAIDPFIEGCGVHNRGVHILCH